jgi:trehalose-6-phosphate synthase
VLILSEFAGAARELTRALIVNPYAIDDAAHALSRALLMPDEEQGNRMREMRSVIAKFNTYRWAGAMLTDATHVSTEASAPAQNVPVSRENAMMHA